MFILLTLFCKAETWKVLACGFCCAVRSKQTVTYLYFQVTVTLRGSGDWKYFNETDNDVSGQETNAGRDVTSNIMVPANSGAGVSFPIIPLKLGNIPITVSAQSTTSADAVKRNLLVQVCGTSCFVLKINYNTKIHSQ